MRVSACSLGQILTVECGFQPLPQKLSGVLMNLKYTMVIQWSEEDQLYLVQFPEFPGQKFITHGKTYPEAAENGQEALAGLIAVLQDSNQPMPIPTPQAA
jgi:predicted RNase H-like HicB family nuclease